VHQCGLKLFGVIMWKLLIIEPFLRKKFKLKLKFVLEFGNVPHVIGNFFASQI
jgi:hypothetical protein